MEVKITLFPSKSGASRSERATTWGKIVKRIEHPKGHVSREVMPLLKLATFGDNRSDKGSLRHDANLLQIHGIEADYDAGRVNLDDAADMLAAVGVEAVLYTTPSHTEERPRWRVLAPLSCPCAPSKRGRMVALLNDALGGILARESFTASQTFYFGKVRGAQYRVRHVKGAPIDTLDLVLAERYPDAKSATAKPERDDFERLATLNAITPDTLADLQKAVRDLAPQRAEDRTAWVNVGHALKSVAQAGYEAEALSLWHEFSARCESKYDAAEAEQRWKTFNPGKITHASIFHWAKEDSAPAAGQRLRAIQAGEFASGKSPGWIIKGVLPHADLGMLFGESGSGKSFIALDMAAAIARGEPWRGHRVKQSPVLYVAAEGAGGFRSRLKAYAQHHRAALDALPLHVIAGRPNLLDAKDAEQIAAEAKRVGAGVVIVDTLAQATPGANENAGEDMGRALKSCDAINRATGALVLLVHHAGKDLTKGARGWSGLRAAVDVELEVQKLTGSRRLRISKQKDGEDGQEFAFNLLPLTIGTDDDGEFVTSCVVDHVEGLPPSVEGQGLGKWQRHVFNAATGLIELGEAASVAAVLARAIEAEPRGEGGRRDRWPECAKRALAELCERGILAVGGGSVRFHNPQSTQT